MSSVMPLTFNAVELCVVTINEKPWTRAQKVCRALEYQKGRERDVLKKHVSIVNKQHKHEPEGCAAVMPPWNHLKTVNLTSTIYGEKACTNWFLEVNSPRRKNLGSIVVT